MSLLVFASAKGAPGVTTSALAIGALWPRPVLVAECDAAGGDIAVRLPRSDGAAVDPDRGLVSLAAEARRGLRPEMVLAHAQTLVGGLDVLAGIRTPEQAPGLASLWPALGSALDALPGVDVIADVGRLTGSDAERPLLRAARGVILFTRPLLTDVVHLRERAVALTAQLRSDAVDGVPVGVVVVAPDRDSRAVDGVRDVLSRLAVPVPVLGRLALDTRGAEVFAGRLDRRVDRTLLVRSAREVTAALSALVEPFSTQASSMPAVEVAP